MTNKMPGTSYEVQQNLRTVVVMKISAERLQSLLTAVMMTMTMVVVKTKGDR